MPKDGEVSEDSSAGFVGSFEDLRAYQKFSHLKHELSDDQAKSSFSLSSLKRTIPSSHYKVCFI